MLLQCQTVSKKVHLSRGRDSKRWKGGREGGKEGWLERKEGGRKEGKHKVRREGRMDWRTEKIKDKEVKEGTDG